MNEEEKTQEAAILNKEEILFIIPQCCREGWPNCPHIAKKLRPSKRNIGL
jgi:hypothetical protein